MKKDLKFYLTISTIVVLSILAWLTVRDEKNATLDINENAFAVADTSAITKVVVTKPNQPLVSLKKENGKWKVSDKYWSEIDDVQQRRLFFCLSQVRVRRPVSEKQLSTIVKRAKENGLKVQVYSANDLVQEFYIDGDQSSDIGSVYVKGNEAYYVDVIGADEFSAAVFFNIQEEAWRNRTLFASQIRSLEDLQIDFLKKPRVTTSIVFDNGFFKVNNVAKLDSNRLGMFLMQYRSVKVDQYLSANDSLVKSYVKAGADFAIQIKDLDSTKNNKVEFYFNPANPNFLIGYSAKEHTPFKISKGKVSRLLAMPQDFEKEQAR